VNFAAAPAIGQVQTPTAGPLYLLRPPRAMLEFGTEGKAELTIADTLKDLQASE